MTDHHPGAYRGTSGLTAMRGEMRAEVARIMNGINPTEKILGMHLPRAKPLLHCVLVCWLLPRYRYRYLSMVIA
jgi:hypothetical protein